MDKQYFNQLKQYQDQQVKQFVQEKWQEYQWISRGIQQRKETILRVMRCIIAKTAEMLLSRIRVCKTNDDEGSSR